MKFFVAFVINLIVLVQITQSHTVPPTIMIKSEPVDGVLEVNPNNNTLPDVAASKPSEPPSIDTNSADQPNEDELVFAQVMYRHGERDIPNRIELTNDGKKHLYELGEYFHRRYGKILGPGYHQDKVYILATDHDRAIMSAQANLAGMFKPTDEETWSHELLWSPVPVHTLPMVLDNILRPRYEDRCPRYDKMYNWYIKKSPEAREMYEKYGHLFKDWARKSGKKVKHIEHVFSIYKKFLSQKQQGESIPAWAEEACAPGGPMEEIAKIVYILRAKPDLVRIRSGFLLKEMLERFKTKQNGQLDPDRALWMYSAHSSTITTLLNGLRFNMSIPSHGFSFQFEMYKTPADKYYLQLFLRQPDIENPPAADMPGCGKTCTLERFYEVYKELIPGEFEIECGVKKPDNPDPTEQPDPDHTEKPNPNSAAINENGRILSIGICSFWFIRKLFSQFSYENF